MIKALTLSALILLAPAAARADDYCDAVGYLAEQVMKVRQNGLPFGDVYKRAEKQKDAEIAALMKRMVIDAYDRSAYQTDDVKRGVINEFRDKYHLECIKAGN